MRRVIIMAAYNAYRILSAFALVAGILTALSLF